MTSDDDRVIIHCLNEIRAAYHRASSERDRWMNIATSLADDMKKTVTDNRVSMLLEERQQLLAQIDNLRAEVQRLEQAVKY